MKINGIEISEDVKEFAYDGCHKIYLIESESDKDEAVDCDYGFASIEDLEEIYATSCSLKFISNWSLTKHYVNQFEDAIFED